MSSPKLALTGPAITLLGVAILCLGFFDRQAVSFLWPFDAVAAIVGGVFITWAVHQIMKPDPDEDEPEIVDASHPDDQVETRSPTNER